MSIETDSGASLRPGRSAHRWAQHALAHLRTRAFELTVGLMSLWQGALILTYYKVRMRPAEVWWLLRSWSSAFLWLARGMLGIRHRFEGWEKVPPGPVIFVLNHQSLWESIAFTVFVERINIVTKRSLLRIPVFGWGLRHAPMITVDRESPGSNLRGILRGAREAVSEGRSLLIFPEGTRLDVGERRPFQRGLEALYAAAGVPLVPIVHNSGLVWPKGVAPKRPGEILLRVLDPVPPGRDPRRVAAEVEALIQREKERLPGVAEAAGR